MGFRPESTLIQPRHFCKISKINVYAIIISYKTSNLENFYEYLKIFL
jgi:hypothetical protein